MAEIVTSMQNKMIKTIAALKQKKHRDEQKLFIAEGIRLVEEAAKSDWEITLCLYTQDAVCNTRVQQILQVISAKNCRMIEVTEQVYHRLSDTEQPQGIMAVIKQKDYGWPQLQREHHCIVVMDQVQDPGNAGTIIRTADAAGCTAVIMTKACVDVYSAKTVRATMGSLFHLPVIYGWDAEQIISNLQTAKVSLYATTLDEVSVAYYTADLAQSCAIVMGNEGNGISDIFLKNAVQKLHIPMLGQAESLNVAVSAAVILYEAVRQRVITCKRDAAML